ncbi:MAG TPA: alpha/beta fold hydrolase [Rhodanobacteraceae bacterium]
MPTDVVPLAFERGPVDGSRVLLIHGLGSDARGTWKDTGVCRALDAAGFGWIAPDLPGHGKSAKPHDAAAYALPVLVRNVLAVLDGIGVAVADVVGYSLGAHVALAIAAAHPERVRRLVLGGIGSAATLPPAVVAQFLTRLPPSADRDAVSACVAGVARSEVSRTGDVRAPALLIAGAADRLAMAGIDALASAIADARVVRVPGRNHFNVLTAQPFKQAICTFLQER